MKYHLAQDALFPPEVATPLIMNQSEIINGSEVLNESENINESETKNESEFINSAEPEPRNPKPEPEARNPKLQTRNQAPLSHDPYRDTSLIRNNQPP